MIWEISWRKCQTNYATMPKHFNKKITSEAATGGVL